MDPIWLDSYPPGVPNDVAIDPDETLPDAFEQAMAAWPNNKAFTNLGHSLTFADIDRLSRAFAAYLQNDLQLQSGDRVALMMPNLLQYPVALFGVLRAGLVAVNVNPLYTARELKHQLVDSGATAIVIYAGSAHVLADVIGETAVKHAIVTQVGDLLPIPKRWLVNFVVRRVRKGVKDYSLPQQIAFRTCLDATGYRKPQDLHGADLAILQYTGGTTGLAKGAMLSHSNLLANIRQVNSWFGGSDVPGEEIMVTALPLYHVYALTVNCFAYFVKGGLNILITDPRETKAMITEMSKWPFTAISGVNTLFQSLVRHPDFAGLDFSTLKVVSAGGMAMQKSTADKWFEITGKHVIEGYGLSETSPVVTSNPISLEAFNGSIGLPMPGTMVSIRDEAGNELPIGQEGELYASGPQVMLGYWQNEAATAKVMTDDGYLQTGDMAVMNPQGFLKIVDRKKDMIIVSGFNVYPNEIENIVTQHPEIHEAAVVGVPGDDSGEMVKLFVVMEPGSTMTPADVRQYCKQNMTPYKVPSEVEFRDSLPKTNVGKVLRRELRDEAVANKAKA